MPIFHQHAFLAGNDGKDSRWLRPEHCANVQGLSAALDRLCPEQRCDALYADWLLQLNNPARQALLQVRNLLLGQGALAANYLAELAQNADDASDAREAQIRIALDGDWLLVSNDGRKVTSLNLLGLRRFFVHAAGEVVELTEQTIGRFGIGFLNRATASPRRCSCSPGIPKTGSGSASPSAGNAMQPQSLTANAWSVCLHGCRLSVWSSLTPNCATSAASATARRSSCRNCRLNWHNEQIPSVRLSGGHYSASIFDPTAAARLRRALPDRSRSFTNFVPCFSRTCESSSLLKHQLEMSVAGRDAAHDVSGLVQADKITLATRDISQPQSRQSKQQFSFWE
jgi:hypothetical protein